jgi:O-antigen/teichoic acid export membrane protein
LPDSILQESASTTVEEPVTTAAEPSVRGRESISSKPLRWMKKGGLAILDNGLISGSNFLLSILLARWLPPDEYGAYALAFSIFILVGFLYQALLLEPLSVFAGSAFRGNLRGYLKKALWIHWAISLPTGLVIAGGAVVARVVGHSIVLPVALAGMAIATPFLCMHAMARRSFYLKLSPGPAAFGAAFYCAMVMGGVYLIYWRGLLSSFTAFLIMGGAALVSAMVMLLQLNSALEPATGAPQLREIWGKHWEYGSWALATCVVGWIPNYVYIPLVSTFSGMAAAGELRALMNLAAPVLQTYAALSMLFLPYAARVSDQQGKKAASALTRKLAALFVVGAVAYWAVLIPLRQPLFHFLYAGKYTESVYLIPLFGLETIVWSASLGPAIVLRAMNSPRSLFVANGAASAVALLVGIPATRYFGLQGVIWSMIFANALYVVVAFVLYGRKVAALTISDVNVAAPVSAD